MRRLQANVNETGQKNSNNKHSQSYTINGINELNKEDKYREN